MGNTFRTKEEKIELIRQWEELRASGTSVIDTVQRLGIRHSQIYDWRSQLKKNAAIEPVPKNTVPLNFKRPHRSTKTKPILMSIPIPKEQPSGKLSLLILQGDSETILNYISKIMNSEAS